MHFDFDSTAVRLPFDCNSTALRPFGDVRNDRSFGCRVTAVRFPFHCTKVARQNRSRVAGVINCNHRKNKQ